MDKVKNIKFEVKFKGNGLINGDSSDQKKMLLNNKIICSDGKVNDNLVYAKKEFIPVTENGETRFKFKFKVSSDAIRHAMYENEMFFNDQNVLQLPYVLYEALATPAFLERGYLKCEKDNVSVKRKSPLSITDAIENGDVLRDSTIFDFHSVTTNKDKTEDDKSSTSIYGIENVGELTYKSDGFIDLQELQFIPFDQVYDRCCADLSNPKNKEIYMNAVKRNIPNYNGKLGYFYKENAYTRDQWGEYGLMFSDENTVWLAKDMLKRMLRLCITKRNAYLEFESLTIWFRDDDLNIMEKRDISSISEIDNLDFSVRCGYNEADEELILRNKEEVERQNAAKAEKTKAQKKSKKSKDSNNDDTENVFE